jgi:hypothetical protein
MPLRPGVNAELGAGPLATFNSTKVNGVKLDEKHLGILATRRSFSISTIAASAWAAITIRKYSAGIQRMPSWSE